MVLFGCHCDLIIGKYLSEADLWVQPPPDGEKVGLPANGAGPLCGLAGLRPRGREATAVIVPRAILPTPASC